MFFCYCVYFNLMFIHLFFRAPFTGDKDYIDIKRDLLSLSFEMAYIAHRGIFSENPVPTIKKICDKFAKIADHIIQVSV